MTDQEQIDMLIAKLEGHDGILDDLVHDATSAQASNINNQGTASQIEYLVSEGWTLTELDATTTKYINKE